MKTYFATVVIALLLSTIFCHGQSVNDSVVYVRKIYKTVDTVQLTAHIFYKPSTIVKKGNTALAFFHGGGWAFGDPNEFFNASKRYAKLGLVAISFQYRLVTDTGNNPEKTITPVECVIDVRSAMRWLREHASDFGVDPNKIVAGGQSVGGQLVLCTAMIDTPNDPQDNLKISPVPNAIISWSGTVNTLEPWCDRLLGNKRAQIWHISPAHNLKRGLPPVIAFHGTKDTMVDLWTVSFFADDMRALGNHFEIHKYEGRQHYLGDPDPFYARLFDEGILKETDDFLRRFGFMKP
ncbi:alpha/beta hydrolase [Larkinella rosea]|uniref:Alpha/beta hydrolase n=1 Tax=Larkinella rosea TaxID=2025312 RepID=A0A3P1BDE8_9BACT|nr:alpha/beta hydrolase [Larkinella rosea]RRA99157.1 alpha/beta hydrolase [Larkinella rosea]